MNGTLSRLGMAALVLVLAGTLVGCNTKRIKAERDRLFIQNQELQDRLTQTQAAHDAAVSDRERMSAEALRLQQEAAAAAAREAAAREAAAAAAARANAGRQSAGGGRGAGSFGQIPDVESFESNGLLTVRVAGDVLFSSGQADLKASSRQTLSKIVAVLKKEYPNHTIRIAGYTDSDPIRKSKWKSNDELSLARANAVRTYLRQQGLPADRMQVAGYGAANPRPTKAQSRRVEIIVELR